LREQLIIGHDHDLRAAVGAPSLKRTEHGQGGAGIVRTLLRHGVAGGVATARTIVDEAYGTQSGGRVGQQQVG
jgi:hypothetical protein